jgi:hypothetical protein
MVVATELDLRIGSFEIQARGIADVEALRPRDRREPITSEYVGGDGIAVQLGPS